MNKQLFNEILFSGHLISKSQVADIEKLANAFPYSPAVRQLYLKSLLDTEDFRFEDQLKKTAVVVQSRKKLKEFLFSNKDFSYSTRNTDLTDHQVVTEEEQIPQISLRVVNNEATPSKTENIAKSLTGLEDDYLAHAIDASISLEVEKERSSKEPIIDQKENPSDKSLPNLKSADKKTKQSFSDWINVYQTEQSERQSKKDEFRKNAEALIDQFIATQPKIVPQKEFFSPINMAKKSIEEPEDLASETLANIYATQGKPQKAIKIYEILILRNPEKKTYFASRINQLKNSK